MISYPYKALCVKRLMTIPVVARQVHQVHRAHQVHHHHQVHHQAAVQAHHHHHQAGSFRMNGP